ncbi:MAG: hypothetical protein OSA92_09810 [Pirellulaceae bacterium]|nr:hypothetical protein [Pirellulaceae bacterium]
MNTQTLSLTLALGLLCSGVSTAAPRLEQAQQVSARTGRPILVMAGADT